MKIKIMSFLVAVLFSFSSFAGGVIANNVYNDYGTTNVSTTPVQVIASINSNVTQIYSFDSSGLLLQLNGTCNGVSQTVLLGRGGDGLEPACFDVGTALTVQTLTGTANTSGTELILNLYH